MMFKATINANKVEDVTEYKTYTSEVLGALLNRISYEVKDPKAVPSEVACLYELLAHKQFFGTDFVINIEDNSMKIHII